MLREVEPVPGLMREVAKRLQSLEDGKPPGEDNLSLRDSRTKRR